MVLELKCLHKFRKSNGVIYGYRLEDRNGNLYDYFPNDLKVDIGNGKIKVINLQLTSNNRLVDYKPQPPLENIKNNGIMGMSNKSIVSRKGKSSMRDYKKISDEELEKLCFMNADKDYITNVISKSKQQVREGKYKVVVSVTGIDKEKKIAIQCN